jgi:hypothetical protein
LRGLQIQPLLCFRLLFRVQRLHSLEVVVQMGMGKEKP